METSGPGRVKRRGEPLAQAVRRGGLRGGDFRQQKTPGL